MNKKDEEKKVRKQFWVAFGFFLGIVGLLVLTYFVLSTLNFFG
jgi:cytoskeletal protein RodZ